MRRTGVAAAGLLVLLLGVTSCGGDDASSADKSTAVKGFSGDCAKKEVFCVGLVTDVGKVDDKSFNQSSWEGAAAGAKAVGGGAEYIETVDPKDYAKNIQSFVDRKVDVVVTVGFALADAAATAATANPGIHFIGVDAFQATTIANLSGLVFYEDRAGFMAGALAGLLTKTNVVAAVLGTDKVPPVVAFGKGWENGAKYTNSKVKVLTTYHPGGLDVAFNDPTWGAQTAKQALDNTADVVFGAGGNTGNGALLEVAKKAGAYCVGVDLDQWETMPGAHACLVTSAEKRIKDGVVLLISQVHNGTAKGGNFRGEVGLASYHDFDAKIPAEVKTKMDVIVRDVGSGKIPTGVN